MGALVTAVVLSPERIRRSVPGCVVLNLAVGTLRDHAAMNRARRTALRMVRTRFWFILDSDDELPEDFAEVLDECIAVPHAVAYTDELIVREGQPDVRRVAGPYDRARHIENLYLLHHLVVCDTERSLMIEPRLPEGVESFESMLYAQLARDSWHYVQRIGYHWHKGNGFHTRPDAVRSMCAAAIWLNRST